MIFFGGATDSYNPIGFTDRATSLCFETNISSLLVLMNSNFNSFNSLLSLAVSLRFFSSVVAVADVHDGQQE